MPQAFEVVRASPEGLTLRLHADGLDGEADELLAFVLSEIDSGRHLAIRLEAQDASMVTLEGIGVVMRLFARARAAGGDLRIISPHPNLERKLIRTGLRSVLLEP